jgi:hypothetical protein
LGNISERATGGEGDKENVREWKTVEEAMYIWI